MGVLFAALLSESGSCRGALAIALDALCAS
jgi:hypothetical protein